MRICVTAFTSALSNRYVEKRGKH